MRMIGRSKIRYKIFRNFPKCGKIRELETYIEGRASLRRVRAATI